MNPTPWCPSACRTTHRAAGPPTARSGCGGRSGECSGGRDGERGGAIAETAIVTPLLLLLVVGVVFIGRIVSADGQLEGAARDAARAASTRRTPTAAATAAQTTAAQAVGGSRVGCRALTVTLATDWRPGGSVTARVACTVPLGDLTLLGVPGSLTRMASATAPLDTFRGVRGG